MDTWQAVATGRARRVQLHMARLIDMHNRQVPAETMGEYLFRTASANKDIRPLLYVVSSNYDAQAAKIARELDAAARQQMQAVG